MNRTQRTRGVIAALVGVVIVAGSMFGGTTAMAAQSKRPSPPPSPPPVPTRVIAALGDSITLAVSSCSSLTSCAANSWATGTSVNSLAARLAIPTTSRFNLAVSGVKVGELPTQATAAVGKGATHVTIEIGANDACTSRADLMTDKDAFAASVSAAMLTLEASPLDPQIFVAAIPSLQTLYEVNVGNGSARFTWGLLKVCQSMLAKPTSVAIEDTTRRTQVQEQVNLYNAALQTACALTTNCHFAASVGAYKAFGQADISTRDYFHPSLTGQATLARIAAADPAWAPFAAG